MLKNAVRLCEAKFGHIYRWDGDALHLVATQNAPVAFAQARKRSPFRPSPETPTGRMIANKTVVHTADLRAEKAYANRDPWIVAGVELGGVRTVLMVPMLKDNELIGAFSVYRQEVRPFTDKQIALVQNFAAQAVIAIENARLLNELRQRTADLTEALEQQTATSEVLQVISSSPGDLEPVFDKMLENAVRICDAKFGNIYRWDGDALHLVATHNTPPAFAEARRRSPIPSRVRKLLSVACWRPKRWFTSPTLRQSRLTLNNAIRQSLQPSNLAVYGRVCAVPMLKENELIGAFTLSRQEVRPFTDKQIALVQNFAAQAVIAIENARLLNELRQRTADLTESLEQQTATSEVLQVISSSPGDLEPVFATMLEKAVRICDARFGTIQRWDGDALHLMATHNAPPAFVDARRGSPVHRPADPNTALGRMVATKTASSRRRSCGRASLH